MCGGGNGRVDGDRLDCWEVGARGDVTRRHVSHRVGLRGGWVSTGGWWVAVLLFRLLFDGCGGGSGGGGGVGGRCCGGWAAWAVVAMAMTGRRRHGNRRWGDCDPAVLVLGSIARGHVLNASCRIWQDSLVGGAVGAPALSVAGDGVPVVRSNVGHQGGRGGGGGGERCVRRVLVGQGGGDGDVCHQGGGGVVVQRCVWCVLVCGF